jgi:DNA-binding MarR family transcriptional regulator
MAALLAAPKVRGVDGMAKRQTQDWKSKLKSTRGMTQWIGLYQAYNAIFKVTELALLPHRLSLPQIYLLSALKGAGGTLTTGEIGRALVKASQSITGLVDRLEEPGLVERVFDRRDRRKTWVRITKKGEQKLAEAFPVATALAEELFSSLSDQELEALQTAVEKLRSASMDRLADFVTTRGA